MTSKLRKAGCVFLAWVMTASLAASGMLALADGEKNKPVSADRIDTVSFKDVTGKVDLTKVALQNLSPSVIENAGFTTVKNEKRTVIVTLDGDCLMEGVTGGQSAAEYLTTYAGGKRLNNIRKEQSDFLNSLSSLGVSYKVKYQYSTVTNAVAIEVDTANLSKIKGISSVKYAVVSETYAYPETEEGASPVSGTKNPSNVYSTGIYDSSKYVEQGYDGSGMTVAVLDTGLDYTHEAFSYMPTGTLSLTKSKLSEKLKTGAFNAVRLSAENGNAINADDLYVNDKVPFAYDYADKDPDVYPSYSQHGPHVAGIVAGHATTYKNKDGETAYEKDANGNTVTDEEGKPVPEEFNGVAPNAQLVICKVFTDDFDSKEIGGATTEGLIAALEDCVLLGVDVINMSLGTTAGFSSMYIEGDDEGQALKTVYESIKAAGISLICAASNDFSSGFGSAFGTNLATNPDSGTVGSPSTFTASLSVASINGQLSPFMYANGKDVIYYQDASDENSVKLNFLEGMLGNKTSGTFKYVIVPGVGQAGNYSTTIKNHLNNKEEGEKVIAVVQRGNNTFKDKVEIAKRAGADAVIIYNNVAGTIGISIGDLDEEYRLPTVSVTMDAGNLLKANGTTGYIEINRAYQAGPFMNDYSSWGTTPDLKIKPEITAHGGEITSSVSGGYSEMSGTSMASPNMAGFVALLRGHLKQLYPEKTNVELTRMVNQIVMSTAVTVYDQDGLPYSPRKQGAGLATLDNVFSTKALLFTHDRNGEEGDTFGAEDNRPKIELGDDKERNGVYDDMIFYVENFGTETLTFTPNTIFMTESLASDGLAVAEKAHLLTDNAAEWWADGVKLEDGATISVSAGAKVKIKVKLTLSDREKKYIDNSFKNGMFVEGFLQLKSSDTEKQCSLSLPFMGFYGDWNDAPMLDYTAFDIAAFKQDTSYTDEDRPQEQVWASQMYATYWHNERYTVPMGSFMYIQDENADQIYTAEEHCAVSRYDNYYGLDDADNYMTTTGLKALYAGLLRNAEIVTYDVYDEQTGEVILVDKLYRISKAYAGGGGSVPANCEIKLYPEELGLVNNGKYRINFHFYFKKEDVNNPEKQREEDTFSMTFYVDYEAPVLVDTRIRYYDYKDGNRDKQRVYLDLDVYDNHYAQAVILCYTNTEGDTTDLKLATEYITPVYNANRNGVTTVSIEITDFYKTYQNRLYCQIDDYALNHSVYQILFGTSNASTLPDDFEIEGANPAHINGIYYDDEITLGVNETYKVALSYEGNANPSNFTWNSTPSIYARVQNGEIFGSRAGNSVVTVTAGTGNNTVQKKIYVHVVQSNTTLSRPNISFGVIKNSGDSLVKASGTVKVNAGEDFTLEVITDPWYYPVNSLNLVWSSSDEDIATVDQNGKVSVLEKKGSVTIRASIKEGDTVTRYSANVTLSVQEPFTISNSVLTAYHGRGGEDGVVKIPDDKNVMSIAEEAFKDNNNIKVIIIPKTVTEIGERAFVNCTALEEVYFIQKEAMPIPDSSLSVIYENAFLGCSKLRKVDLSNVKKITLDKGVFYECTSLEEVVHMDKIGSMYDYAFYGCTSLKEADITGLHVTGVGVFGNCTKLETVKTDYYSSIGESIFAGCANLKTLVINSPIVGANAFAGCSELKSVVFGGEGASNLLDEFSIGAGAFYNCIKLESVTFGDGYKVSYIGDMAFSGCRELSSINLTDGVQLGVKVFEDTKINVYDDVYGGAIYSGTTLIIAPDVITADFAIRAGTTEIAAYAFGGSEFEEGVTLVIPDTVTKIGEGAFNRSTVKSITLSANITEIPAFAFAVTSLESIVIPAGTEAIGAYAFANSLNLTSVTFAGSENLALGANAFYGCASLAEITLPAIAGGEIGERTFYGCASLVSANIANVKKVLKEAFYGCIKLETVTGLENLTDIGDAAFYNCPLKTLGLTSAVTVGDSAFFNEAAKYTSLSIPAVVTIGEFAFYGGGESTVAIPATLTKLGGGAFAGSHNLTSFTASGDKFFADGGVLYRVISGAGYELAAYPSALATEDKKYTVKDGTVSINAGAFRGLTRGVITEVILPYSLKEIGDGAFYASGITSYVFNSITAPTLLTKYFESELITFKTLYYTNFETELQNFVSDNNPQNSNLKISYPTNGEGYDNYVYEHYFATKSLLGELMDDTTRTLKGIIEGFESASTVSGWVNLENNSANRKKVTDFSDEVKRAHTTYLTVTGEKQLEYLGADNVQKLFDIEAALKPVKLHFGIPVTVSSLSVASDSTHRHEYKVGEKFDITGLKIIITYDDYSTEQADLSKVTIDSYYDRPLETYDNEVALTYEGRTVRVLITVSEEVDEPPVPEENKKSGCKSAIGGTVGGFAALGLLAGALAVAVIVKRKRV